MRLNRLSQGHLGMPNLLNRSLRREVASREAWLVRRWRRSIPAAIKARLGARRGRCGNGRRIGPVWDDAIRAEVLRGLRATGNVRIVAATLKLGRQTLYRKRKEDPRMDEEWNDALEQRYKRLEVAAVDRLTLGYQHVIYDGDGEPTRSYCRYDHGPAVRMIDLHHRRKAAAAQLAERRAERAAKEQREAEKAEAARAPFPDEADRIAPRHKLFLNLMERHRNRHPHEWDGDIHTVSGFDFEDWRTWVAEWEEEHRSQESHDAWVALEREAPEREAREREAEAQQAAAREAAEAAVARRKEQNAEILNWTRRTGGGRLAQPWDEFVTEDDPIAKYWQPEKKDADAKRDKTDAKDDTTNAKGDTTDAKEDQRE